MEVCKPEKELPLLQPAQSKNKKEPWDYEGRSWYMYAHIISQRYGWTLGEIGRMDLDDALALVQEILTDEQLDREFLWSMSENSYIYNAKTKTGKPNPLERPYWMIVKVEPPKRMQIPKNMIPAGADFGAIPDEYKPIQPTNHENQTQGIGSTGDVGLVHN